MNSFNINCLFSIDFYVNFFMYSLYKVVESLIKNIVFIVFIYFFGRSKCLVDILGNGFLIWEK